MADFPIFDAHFDILQSPSADDKNDSYYCVDFNELYRNRPIIRSLVSFVRPTFANIGVQKVNQSLYMLYEDYSKNKDKICIIKKANDFDKVIKNKLVGVVLAIENGSAIQGNLDNIHYFYERGVRTMGITWNDDNDLGCGVATKCDTGLTSLGKRYIQELNKQGILIDVSHASPKTVDDVLNLSNSPIIASHSCVKSICEHRRNLTDEQIKGIAKNGGVVGITFYKSFLNNKSKADAADVAKHIDYVVNMVGIEHVGIGTDFQLLEPESTPSNVRNIDEFENIFDELRSKNYKEDDIAKVAGGNFINLMCQII